MFHAIQQVNLKEQGRLLRQNEFLVWQGRGKKCLRHVFLFEELILFSKARRFPDRKVILFAINVSSVPAMPLFARFITNKGRLIRKQPCARLVRVVMALQDHSYVVQRSTLFEGFVASILERNWQV